MKWLTLFLCLLAGPALAQESKRFVATQECEHVVTMAGMVMQEYGEKPLFSGLTIQIAAANGQAYTSDAMFFVNQESGTWSLIGMYADGTGCLIASGTDFSPYVGDVNFADRN
jgi:hypothetical protein